MTDIVATDIVPVRNKDGVEINAIDPQPVGATGDTAENATGDATGDTAENATGPKKKGKKPAPAKPKGKRGPGRPKTRVETPNFPTEGVIGTPHFDDSIIEMVYGQPMIFRKIFALLKSFNIPTLKLDFTDDKIMISGLGHYKKERANVIIEGKTLIRYFCSKNITRHMELDEMDKKTKTINKSHGTVSLIIKEEDERSTMHMALYMTAYNTDLPMKIPFRLNANEGNTPEQNDEDYPICFEMESSHFKSMITSFISGIGADTMTIKKVGNEPLTIIPQSADKALSDGLFFKNPQKINLKSTIPPDTIFSASVKILYFKPLAMANIGDKIEIRADSFKPMSFTTWIDKTNYPDELNGEKIISTGYTSIFKLFVEIEG